MKTSPCETDIVCFHRAIDMTLDETEGGQGLQSALTALES